MLDDKKEPQAPDSELVPPSDTSEGGQPDISPHAPASAANSDDAGPVNEEAYGYERYEPSEDDPYNGEPYEPPAAAPDNYGSSQPGQSLVQQSVEAPGLAGHQQTIDIRPEAPGPIAKSSEPPPPPPPPSTPDDEEEDDEEEGGMLRMSFMEHLEELRARILKALVGVGVAFVACLLIADPLWRIVSAPAIIALKHLHYNPQLVAISPMEQFSIIWVKMPLLVSLFVGSPWVLYQVWAFISPGLYKRERRYAVPFILCTAGLFIAGGMFAYFVAFRYGLEFLLGIGRDINVAPMVSINEYFDLFMNVILGIAVVFELPVLIFFLTLLHIASPRFLIKNSRYAVLAIVVLASIVTPTPDVFNLMLFAVPMCMLFFIGVFVSYLLVLKREGKTFPWGKVWLAIAAFLLVAAGVVALLIYRYHFHVIQHWPFLTR
jgi:Twin arginine targeting (Tat) protein translocase TatC